MHAFQGHPGQRRPSWHEGVFLKLWWAGQGGSAQDFCPYLTGQCLSHGRAFLHGVLGNVVCLPAQKAKGKGWMNHRFATVW